LLTVITIPIFRGEKDETLEEDFFRMVAGLVTAARRLRPPEATGIHKTRQRCGAAQLALPILRRREDVYTIGAADPYIMFASGGRGGQCW
jgi:hypothetical protein